ncbi:hypothetical protein QZH41_007091 [Actinostola sp. cb2023]|nr:hypothetical protein QZH41_007091 [Actinostola sp. cb2023]
MGRGRLRPKARGTFFMMEKSVSCYDDTCNGVEKRRHDQHENERYTLDDLLMGRQVQFARINGMLSMTLFVASISTLCCISVDRYYAVVKPVKYKNIFTVRKAGFMLAFSWLIAVLCASLPVFGWTDYELMFLVFFRFRV